MDDKMNAADAVGGFLLMNTGNRERATLRGVFTATLTREGRVVWEDEFHNTVMTIGKNVALDAFLAGSAYTVTGPFMGLISSTSYSSINAADTMASHSGWLEAGTANTPHYTTVRPTCAWSAASGGAKALSAALSFTFTGSGTVKGAFLCYGTGAVSTIDSTAGTLLSAGLFTGGDRAVVTSDVLNVSYTLAL